MIDTRNKRASLFGLGLAAQLVLPSPGSDLSQLATRQQFAGLYAAAGASAVDIPEGARRVVFAPRPSTIRFEV